MFGGNEPRIAAMGDEAQGALRALRNATSAERIASTIRAFPAPRNRLHSPDAMRAMDALLEDGFRSAGWKTHLQPYTFTDVAGWSDHGGFGPTRYARLAGANVVAIRPGRGPRALVVAAHHDTIRDSPGADDNGAGVAALLELARVIPDEDLDATIVLAAVDMEELGFFGSRHLVSTLSASYQIDAAIVYETMGYTARAPGTQLLPAGIGPIYARQVRAMRERGMRGDWTCVIHRKREEPVAADLAQALRALDGEAHLLRDPNDLPVLGPLLRRTVPFVRDFARSDHVSFWRAGAPAILVTDTANFRNPHYHRPTDTPDTLDHSRIADIVAATVHVLLERAGGKRRPK